MSCFVVKNIVPEDKCEESVGVKCGSLKENAKKSKKTKKQYSGDLKVWKKGDPEPDEVDFPDLKYDPSLEATTKENDDKSKKRKFEISFKEDSECEEQSSKDIPKSLREVSPKPKVNPAILKKYTTGEGIGIGANIKNLTHKKKLLRKEKKLKWAEEQAARAEVLLTEDAGFLIPDEGEVTKRISQGQIKKAVDITSAAKCFELDLSFGPYRLDYTRNGRHLLLGGKRGHIAAIDWITKRLLCEINVMESVYDVQWLHLETMFAVAQKEWVYIYDNKGVELHCIKQLDRVLQMAFLPYHFLLATSNEKGWLSWLDVSLGKMVNQINTRQGRLSVMKQNPYNAVLCLGHSKGVVSMWSPNSPKPLAQILCHRTGVQGIAIDHTGKYMATSSADRQLKIWDVRELVGPLQSYQLRGAPNDLTFSQRGLLALGINNTVEVYKNCHLTSVKDSYLSHRTDKTIFNLEFCPYEDVLGLATGSGFTSMLVPGAGEPNFDALECNPMQTKSQRREAEVKALLEKIQPEMITLDPTIITEVDLPTLKDKIEAKKQLIHIKAPKIDFTPRRKKKHGNTVRAAKAKKIVQENHKREFIKDMKNVKGDIMKDDGVIKGRKSNYSSVLDRFQPKK